MGRTLGFHSEPMKSAVLLFATFLLLSLATATAAAKSSSIGIYAVIDEVKFNQDGPSSTWYGSLVFSLFPDRCQAANTRLLSAAIFTSGFLLEPNRQRERIGTNSRQSLERVRSSGLPFTGCRIRAILRVIHTIRSN